MQETIRKMGEIHKRLGLNPSTYTEPEADPHRYIATYASIPQNVRKKLIAAVNKIADAARHLDITHEHVDESTHRIKIGQKPLEETGTREPAPRPREPVAGEYEETRPERELVGAPK